MPLDRLSRSSRGARLGYNEFGYPDFGWTTPHYNFKDTTGDFNNIVSQLYFRQAMAHLEDEPGYIKAFFHGAGGQAYGPVPASRRARSRPPTRDQPLPVQHQRGDQPAEGARLDGHAGGTDVCCQARAPAPTSAARASRPGTKLAFNLVYDSSPTIIGQQMTDLASKAKQVGINITLQSSNFNYMISNYNDPAAPTNANKWAMEDFGGFTQPHLPDHVRPVQHRRLQQHRQLQRPEGRQADQRLHRRAATRPR